MLYCKWYHILVSVALAFVTAWSCEARVVNTCLIDELGEDKVISPWSDDYDSVCSMKDVVYV